ncbi:hypothetical protein K431DRAFT_343210 [Polychaeton citri CBS 116435]|uniref:F-box domain-containing protein n=1 Tax=Polychaeton citri CBS 116435 TaxID=1314669 RepID=A0A9P4QGM1_9PEZI|nr:hypothetical protein K431DRAFT_343210 [Polychaeton citri CBS 116435]
MGLLKHFRSRSKLRSSDAASQPQAATYDYPPLPIRKGSNPFAQYQQQPTGKDWTKDLPLRVLERIFAHVCPHTQDFTYETSENSQIGDGCMLCDLRDLASCARVCKRWGQSAQKQLYTSVRIDAVHYCELEEILAEKRKKQAKHLRKSSRVEPGEVPNIRLSLLSRTVRDNPRLGGQVMFIKLPYMTRETAKGDLARAVSAMPNVRYIDLPEGFYSADSSCLPLRQEVQARCPALRKMTYRAGAEDDLAIHLHGYWNAVEVLELNGLAVEQQLVRMVVANLPQLRELTLTDMDMMDDSLFESFPGRLPDFPALERLTLDNTSQISAEGLKQWLQAPTVREKLSSLTLSNTGVYVSGLHSLLWGATGLTHLSISETVTKSLALAQHSQDIPPLASISLRVLHFEIDSSEDVHTLQKPAESYYAYLCSSLHQNSLPALETLYVRDTNFPELLLTPPLPGQPLAPGGGGDRLSLKPTLSKSSTGSFAANPTLSLYGLPPGKNGAPGTSAFKQPLEIFSKGIDELEWVFTSIAPNNANNYASANSPLPAPPSMRAIGGRPLSAYSASRGLGPQWAHGGFGGEARQSVVVGNGFGGFLAVPSEEVPRPRTSEGPGTGAVRASGMFGHASKLSDSGIGSGGAGGRASWLHPPSAPFAAKNRERRGSKHDLWR